ncbi:m12 protein [Murid betaherpesvirus 1]|nr:m12 protein [Murid betaherpesvirus 1]
MFHRRRTGSFITVIISLTVMSITFSSPQITGVSTANNVSCTRNVTLWEGFVFVPGRCISHIGIKYLNKPPYVRTPVIYSRKRVTKKKPTVKPITTIKRFGCPVEKNFCLNATWFAQVYVRVSKNEEKTIGNFSYISTNSSPTRLIEISATEPWTFKDLWINYSTGEIHQFSNTTSSDPKCFTTVCIPAVTSPPISRTNLPFGATDKRLTTSTIDNGTIAAIVLVSAICVGLIVLAILYRRRRFVRIK